MDRIDAINRLRSILSEDDISAMIIPSNDPHFGEYIPDYYKCREWLSGFTGSAGTLVITTDKAALWTDSRYFIQAASQLEGSGITLMKQKVEGTPTINQWLKDNLTEEDIVAVDENLFSYQEYSALVDDLSPVTATMIEDPFSRIWEDRPALEFGTIDNMPEEYAGESVTSKHKRLCEMLHSPLPFAYIVTSLDEIAWLCNIRGKDVEYNPVALSYAVVFPEKIVLFISQDMLTPEAMRSLTSQGVEIEDYESFTDYLTAIGKKYVRIFSSNKVTAKNYFAALENIYQPAVFPPAISDPTPGGSINLMKAVKNRVELDGFRKAYGQDGVAWGKLLDFIKTNITDKPADEYSKSPLTEYDVMEKIIEFRSESPDYRGESFEPIVAYGANAALPHYCPATREEASVIEQKGFLLIDCGGQYAFGTTDTTRTIPVGPLTEEEREDYTAVLKGMVDLSMAKFPKGLRGCLLDIIARGPVFNLGKKYLHGTCHGIGHYLCVHEGPQSVRMEENPVGLVPGMVMSNEPAVYVEGSHGIRHENTIAIIPFEASQGEFCQFETLTKVPVYKEPIVENMLSDQEKEWLYRQGFINQPF